ncbi:MAG: carboxymuconolactone decarboxylase family protein [Rhodoblastus sp.]
MMPRLPDLDPATLDAEQKRIHDEIASGPRGKVEGPLRVWLTSAGLADKAQALGAFCRYGTSLPPRLSELAILVTGAYWRAGFEWHVHAPIGVAAGLDPQAVEKDSRRRRTRSRQRRGKGRLCLFTRIARKPPRVRRDLCFC